MSISFRGFSFILAALLIAACVGVAYGVPRVHAQTGSLAELQLLIDSLTRQIESLKVQVQNSTSVSPAAAITRALSRGSTGADVSALQQFLKSKSFFFADVSGYFGPLTEQAVMAFQSANGLETVGVVGPRTRALINTLLGASSQTQSAPAIFVRPLALGSTGSDVIVLQQVLKSNGHFSGEPTGYFDSTTEAALIAFQKANNLEGVGVVGPLTRLVLNAKVAQGSAASNPNPPVTTTPTDMIPPTVSVSATPNLVGGSAQMTLSAATSENASCRYSVNSNIPFGLMAAAYASTGGTSHLATLEGLLNLATYTYYTKCRDIAGNVSNDVPISFSFATLDDSTNPSAPANLTASAASSSQINLSWSASSDNVGVTGYRVYRDGSHIATSTSTSFSDTGLAASTAYAYRVRATDAAGNVSSNSNSVSATTLAASAAANTNSNLPTISLAASPTSIQSGQSSTLSWSSTNATSCTASNGWSGTKAMSGAQSVSPTANTTYTLTCTGSGGSANQSATISVSTVQSPPGGGVASTDAIPSNRLIDWSRAGIPGGIPNRTTICATLAAGATVAQINSAISGCSSGVVYLSAGTYTLSGSINLSKNNVTLRGAGPTQTILRKAAGMIKMGGSDNTGSAVSITGGTAKGSTQITVASASGFAAGDFVIVRQTNPSFATATGEATCDWCSNDDPSHLITQANRITAVSGSTLTLEQPLYLDFTLTPQVLKLTGMVSSVGVEDLRLESTSGGSGGGNISGNGCAYCWVKNVQSEKAGNAHFWFDGANYANEFRQNVIHDGWAFNSDHAYGIRIGGWTSAFLIEDNLFERLRHSMVFEGGGNGFVIAYNYFKDPHSDDSGYLGEEMLYHGTHPFMNLWEGNIGTTIYADNQFGSNSHSTYFRNWVSGKKSESNSWGTVVDVQYHSLYHSFVGNVLGYSGIASNSEWSYEGGCTGGTDFKIWRWGCTDQSSGPQNTAVKPSAILHGNYDYKRNQFDWQTGKSQNLPASLYRTSKPAWFGSLPWPAVGPNPSNPATLLIGTIPAKVRYEGGSI